MAFLAHSSGQRESELLDRLGYEFFGCNPAELEDVVSSHHRGEVAPVHVNAESRLYIEFSFRQPPSPRPFYLQDNRYTLPVNIATFTDEEYRRWRTACELRDGTKGL